MLGQCEKINKCPYDVVPLPQILSSDDNLLMRRSNTATLEYLEQAGMRAVISSTKCPWKDEKSGMGDVVTSGIEFVEEWEKNHGSCEGG